jgi:hypothetical protein
MDFVTAGVAFQLHWFVICVVVCNCGTDWHVCQGCLRMGCYGRIWGETGEGATGGMHSEEHHDVFT